jgi:hypothetical protein
MSSFKPKMLDKSTFLEHQELSDSLQRNADWGEFELSLPGFE